MIRNIRPWVGGRRDVLRAALLLVALVLCGCPVGNQPPVDNDNIATPSYANTKDPTNKSASYVGGGACQACHPDINATQRIHGHGHMLTRVQGQPPVFPAEGARAGAPNPPEGSTWDDISYVIGGYTKEALFIDNEGYILTTGLEGVPTQWNLLLPENGTTPGFVAYEGAATARKPYDFACFVCHTTGARPQDEDNPQYQENRPGFIGTWEEPGVQCEACHGPGSNHIPMPAARDIFVDTAAAACGKCHTRGEDPNVIIAEGGYIKNYEQYPELLASGGHAKFQCIICHEAHVSTNYDRTNGLRNQCADCHEDQNMALHSGKTFRRGDYVEPLSCESCHMPFATKSGAAATVDVVGPNGRMGDTRTHIFRINTQAVNYEGMFTDDRAAVRKDSAGRAAVTVDFVCVRCHNGIGNVFDLTVDRASELATDIHKFQTGSP